MQPFILSRVSGAENLFVLVDGLLGPLPADPAALARELCAEPFPAGPPADGRLPDGILLLSAPSSADADAALEIRNRDGSRPEACGNGLRCVAWYLLREGRTAAEAARIETDAGLREVRLVDPPSLPASSSPRADATAAAEARDIPRRATLLASMGPPRCSAPDPPLALEPGERDALAVHLGNPHVILRVDDERAIDVPRRGAALQHHPAFPAGVNAGFLATRAGRHHLRVFERGVGETRACGTNACAAAAYLTLREGLTGPLEIHLPGGPLRVEPTHDELLLEGPAEWLAAFESPSSLGAEQ